MQRYRIEYRDDSDPGCPTFTTTIKAYDRDHAVERFHDAPDGEGWEILSITEA